MTTTPNTTPAAFCPSVGLVDACVRCIRNPANHPPGTQSTRPPIAEPHIHALTNECLRFSPMLAPVP